MAFRVAQFAKIRPYLYHLTDRRNVRGIRITRTLQSAAELMKQAGDGLFLRRKRATSVVVRIGRSQVTIRDQRPLHRGNITFESDWSFEDVIESLNERVFFWPGNHNGPISYGERHFERYVDEHPVIVRIPTEDLFASNSTAEPTFCRYNSGSPRCSQGVGSPRGPRTFLSCASADFTAGKVVEVTFVQNVELPRSTELSDSAFGPWRPLWAGKSGAARQRGKDHA